MVGLMLRCVIAMSLTVGSMRVHFVVPYYMEPRYLFELIESVRSQTSDQWRLTIVDDLYPGTAAEDYIRELSDPRICYLRNESNLGATGNSRKVMGMGELEVTMSLGADDAVEPNYVEVVLAAFEEHPDAIMVHPRVNIIDSDGNPTDTLADKVKRVASRSAWKRGELDAETALRSLMRGNWLYQPAISFRTDAVSRAQLSRDFGSIGDLAWAVDMLLGGGTIVLDPTPAARYRRHAVSHSSLNAKSTRRFDEEQRYYAYASALLRQHGMKRAARMARLHPLCRLHAVQAALAALAHGKVKVSLAMAWRSVRPVGNLG
jgi:GT2 family glycosyltransferase